MLDAYVWNTPNGQKLYIALEEFGATHTIHTVDIGAGEQFDEEYKKINPNAKIPALVDRETGEGVFESGAILILMAERYHKFMPQEKRAEVLGWLMFQMASVGPMFGQCFHFMMHAPEKVDDESKLEYAQERYKDEVKRLVEVMNDHLEGTVGGFFASEYSIADMALYPWVKHYDRLGMERDDAPALAAWCDRVGERPAVKRAMKRAKQDANAHEGK